MAKMSARISNNITEFLAEIHNDTVAISEQAARAVAASLEYGKKIAREEAFLDARTYYTPTYQGLADAMKGRFYKRSSRGIKTPHPQGNQIGYHSFRKNGKRQPVPRIYHDKKIMMRTGNMLERFAPQSWRSLLTTERKLASAELVGQRRRKRGQPFATGREYGEPIYIGQGGAVDLRSYVCYDARGKRWVGVVEVIGGVGVALRSLEYGRRIDMSKPNRGGNRKGYRPSVGNALRKGVRRMSQYINQKRPTP